MIAEAWARRRYPAAFINKVDEALGEAMETQAWLRLIVAMWTAINIVLSMNHGKRLARCSIA
jgi:four helix bundle protein